MADMMAPQNMQPQNEEMLLKYMMQQGAHSAADQSIAKKQALLNQLRQTTELPGMIQGGGARTVQAAHPLSAIANVAGQVMGAQQQRGLNTETENLVGQRRQDLANLVEDRRMAQQSALPLEKRAGYVPPQQVPMAGAPLPIDPTQTYGSP